MSKPTSLQTLRWFACSVSLPVVTLLATAAFMSIPPDTRGIDLVSGGELFTVHCGSCHFAKVGFPAHHGPNLHDIGKTGASRKPNLSAAEYILESILDPSAFVAPSGRPGMPPNVVDELAPQDVRNIVGYLASCGAFPNYDEIVSLDVPDRRSKKTEPRLIRLADMQLAEQVLRIKGACLQCHALDSAPENAVFAPGLFGVGLDNEETLRESILYPHREMKPRYRLVTVLLEDGEIVSGQLISRNDERLILCAQDVHNRLVIRDIPLAEIEQENGQPQIKESKISLMPAGFDKSLTDEEINAVINLIRQLN